MVMCCFLFLEAFFLDMLSVLLLFTTLFEALLPPTVPTRSAVFYTDYRPGVASWTELHSRR